MFEYNLELENLKKKKNKLEKKDIDLIITDFDNTIFCRNEQLKDSELLRNNRWKKWNDVIKSLIWIDNFINKYYKDKKHPISISSKLKEKYDLILTAWDKETQTKKIKATKLNKINHIIVEKAEYKIIETIKYIINHLWFIPSKITIYEDRPDFFIEHKDFLENFLETKIKIMFVEMKNNEKNPIIKEVA